MAGNATVTGRQPRLGKTGLIIWLALPFVILTGLYLSIDRSKGKPNTRLEAVQRAQLPGQDTATGRSIADIEREKAETAERIAKQKAEGETKPQAKPEVQSEIGSAIEDSEQEAELGIVKKSPAAAKPAEVTVSTGTIKRLSLTDPAGKIVSPREVLVWLPPGYDSAENKSQRYSVLYMQDGQELFSKRQGVAAPGEWLVDETVSKLMADGKIEPLIVVGIVCAEDARTSEYLTLPLIEGHPPLGMEYVEFVAKVVKPAIEKDFRVQAGPEHTGIGGASLGSMVAIEAGLKYPELFGKVLMESPPLVERNRAFFNRLSRSRSWPMKLSVAMGGMENPKFPATAAENRKKLEGARALSEMLYGYGLREDRLRVDLDADGSRDVATWSRRFGPAVRWLFAAAPKPAEAAVPPAIPEGTKP